MSLCVAVQRRLFQNYVLFRLTYSGTVCLITTASTAQRTGPGVQAGSHEEQIMGTRSNIAVQRADGSWARIYCHWDGYLEGVGRTLFDHYTSQTQAEALVAPGDLSSLGASCSKPKGHTFEKPAAGHCVYYGRDRGEPGVGAEIGETLQALWPDDESWVEFLYVWKDGKWWVGDPAEGTQALIDLGDALLGKRELTPAVKAFGAVIGKHHATDPAKPHGWTWNQAQDQGRLPL
jgi:hypothetical protein